MADKLLLNIWLNMNPLSNRTMYTDLEVHPKYERILKKGKLLHDIMSQILLQ